MAHEAVSKIVFMYGFVTGYGRKTINIQDITHHKDRSIIDHRIKVLKFYDSYVEATTKEAFAVSRSTIFLWKQKLRDSNGRLVSLAPKSKAPNVSRRRETNELIARFIVNERTSHPRLGKDKLRELLVPFCSNEGIACPSVSSVDRILADLKAQGELPKYEKLTLNGRTGRIYPKRHQSNLVKERRGSYYPKNQRRTLISRSNDARRW